MVSEPLLALFPMWFLTYKYKGEQYTCVVNGQTGKVVAGVPLAKYKFAIFCTVLAIVTIALGLIASLTLSITEPVYLIYLAIFAIGQLGIGIAEFERARKSVMRSKSSVTRITGAPPSYIGFDEPGLFSILENNPRCCFVLEEIEKAHQSEKVIIFDACPLVKTIPENYLKKIMLPLP